MCLLISLTHSQDLLNSATLCVLLWTRVKNFNDNSDGILKQMIALAIETAAYTTILAIAGGTHL